MGIADQSAPGIFHPGDNVSLWRYMDLAKYLSMLSTRSLWFSRADLLGDPFEGTMPRQVRQHGGLNPLSVVSVSTLQPDYRVPKREEPAAKQHYVNCWHESEDESTAMWTIYSTGHGIAVKTTLANMRHAVGGRFAIFVGKVKYIDYRTETFEVGSSFIPFLRKRKSYEHEREVRAIFNPDYAGGATLRSPTSVLLQPQLLSIAGAEHPEGHSIQVNLSQLLTGVLVHPDAPEWFFSAVEDATRKFGLSAESVRVERSALDDDLV